MDRSVQRENPWVVWVRIVTTLVLVSTLIALPEDSALASDLRDGIDCNCSKTGSFVKPNSGKAPEVKVISSSDGLTVGTSPGGKYRFEKDANAISVYRIGSHDVRVFNESIGGHSVGYGFSPDDERFVLHWMSGPSHHMRLYDLEKATANTPAPQVEDAEQELNSGSVQVRFSNKGRYLLHAALVASATEIRISVHDARTGRRAHLAQFPNVTAPADGKTRFGSAYWGFSPDANDATLAYHRVIDDSNTEWNLVRLVDGIVVHTEILDAYSGYWEFSPCGDVVGSVHSPGQGPIQARFLRTLDGSVVTLHAFSQGTGSTTFKMETTSTQHVFKVNADVVMWMDGPVRTCSSGPVAAFSTRVTDPISTGVSYAQGDDLLRGISYTFEDTSTGSITGRSWDLGDGTTASGTSVVHTFRSAGSFTVRLTVTGGEGSSTETRQFRVVEPPAPTAAIQVPSNDAPADEPGGIWSGVAYQFADASTLAAGKGRIVSWRWEFGDGGSSAEQNPHHRYDLAAEGPRVVQLTVTSSTGESATASSTVMLLRPPRPTAAIHIGQDVRDLGEPVSVTDISEVPAGTEERSWRVGGVPISSEEVEISIPGCSDVEVELRVKDRAGQTDAASATLSVQASEMPVGEVVPAPEPQFTDPRDALVYDPNALARVGMDQGAYGTSHCAISPDRVEGLNTAVGFGHCDANPDDPLVPPTCPSAEIHSRANAESRLSPDAGAEQHRLHSALRTAGPKKEWRRRNADAITRSRQQYRVQGTDGQVVSGDLAMDVRFASGANGANVGSLGVGDVDLWEVRVEGCEDFGDPDCRPRIRQNRLGQLSIRGETSIDSSGHEEFEYLSVTQDGQFCGDPEDECWDRDVQERADSWSGRGKAAKVYSKEFRISFNAAPGTYLETRTSGFLISNSGRHEHCDTAACDAYGRMTFDLDIDVRTPGASITPLSAYKRVNQKPIAGDHQVVTQRNTAVTLDVLEGASDPDGDPLMVSASDTESREGGSVSCESMGLCTFTPSLDFVGADSFEYTISDPHGATATGVVSVAVEVPVELPRFEETDEALGWSGSWRTVTSTNRSGGSAVWSQTRGGFVEAVVDGPVVRWIGARGPNRGIAEVHIDGKLVDTIDLYAEATRPQQVLFEAYELGEGPHRVRIVNTGERNESSSRPRIEVDALEAQSLVTPPATETSGGHFAT
jgi:PKD repeat protein